ncbi:MAG: glycosyltransferase family 2 protein [Mycobacteriales bacterium]
MRRARNYPTEEQRRAESVALAAERARGAWLLRAAVLGGLAFGMVALRVIRTLLWASGRVPTGPVEKILSYGSTLWALPALPAALALLGMMMYPGLPPRRTPAGSDPWHPNASAVEVCFRIVSRGQNTAALRLTVQAVRRELAARPLFRRWRIEVVTDEPVDIEAGPDLRAFVVPSDYATPHGALYKARALQYALERSGLPDSAWILHLDEESQVTPSLVVGMQEAILEEEASGTHRIGQGAILYHQHLRKHPLLTLADMIRTGDDLGRFYLQHRLGFTLFGLHGSFILVRNSVEKQVGFDFGPEGSITEDAFWALREMAAGNRCRWVDGFLLEQSTQSVRDFVLQRRRWFAGMGRAVLYAQAPAWIRVPLAVFTALWSISWLSMLYTCLNVITGLRTSLPLSLLGDFAYVTYAITYLVGLHVNLRDRPGMPWRRRATLYLLQVVLLPIFTTLEAAGVVAGIVRAERGFHVVRK